MCGVLREGSCRWNEKWREGGRPAGKSLPWERGAGDVTGDRVVSESQERRWSKMSLSSCSFLLKVQLCHSYPVLWALGIHYTTPPLSPGRQQNRKNSQRRRKFNRQTQGWIFNNSAVTVVQILHQDMLITKHTSPLSFLFQATVTHLFEGVTCNCLECLFYINGFFGAGLKVGDVVLTLTPSLSPFGGYL